MARIKRTAAHAAADARYNRSTERLASRRRYNESEHGREIKNRLERERYRRMKAEARQDGPSYQDLRSQLKVFRALGWVEPTVSLQQRRPLLIAIWRKALERIALLEFHF